MKLLKLTIYIKTLKHSLIKYITNIMEYETDEPIKHICKSKTVDYVKEYNQKYYEKTKDKRLAVIKFKVFCECGCELSQGRINKHKKTKKHIDRMTKNANL